ncbi:MAG: phospholipase D-like domain-containing protein, partial [Betaproteobacteria bacterium]
RVLEFNPINPAKGRSSYVLDHRDHRKILIVDGATAFTGGINFSSVYSSGSFGRPRIVTGKNTVPWRDTQVEIRGPVVADFQRLFMGTWKKQNAEPLPPRDYFPHVQAAGNQIVRAVGSTPDDKVSVIQTTLLSAIVHAERTIHITNAYFVPDPAITRALKRAAKRGVDVKLLLPGVSDFWAVMAAARSHYGELIEAGVKIYERKEALLHAKTVVIDSVWSTVGSTNLDRRSLLNDEVDAIVLADDFAAQMEVMFADDLAQSRLVVLSEWQHRGATERMKEFGARLMERWL